MAPTDKVPHVAPAKYSDPWYSLPGVVYFITAGSGCQTCRSVKIGVTTRESLLRRLRAIQSSNHTRIRLLRIIECSTMLEAEEKEKELHMEFQSLSRMQLGSVGSEWFEETPALMKRIEGEGVLLDAAAPNLPHTASIKALFGDQALKPAQ